MKEIAEGICVYRESIWA